MAHGQEISKATNWLAYTLSKIPAEMELFTVVSGEKFNELYKGVEFVKLTNKSENHNGFQFKDGLNIDTIPFNPEGECLPGGIYFITMENLGLWVNYSVEIMVYARIVVIPKGARVYADRGKFKTDQIILRHRRIIFEETDLIILAINAEGRFLRYVREQTEEICKLAVQQNGYSLEFVKEQTEEICKLAVQQHGLALEYVKGQTEEICKLAVQQHGLALDYVKEQTDEICKLAVQQDGYVCEHAKETDERDL